MLFIKFIAMIWKEKFKIILDIASSWVCYIYGRFLRMFQELFWFHLLVGFINLYQK